MAYIKDLLGKTLVSVHKDGDQIVFNTTDGKTYKMYHSQDCCESVVIDDINGDLTDLVGTPITLAEEVSNPEFEAKFEASFTKENECGYDIGNYKPDSYTWTFYRLATVKGYVDIRWFGESNGYYSEGVDFVELGVDEGF